MINILGIPALVLIGRGWRFLVDHVHVRRPHIGSMIFHILDSLLRRCFGGSAKPCFGSLSRAVSFSSERLVDLISHGQVDAPSAIYGRFAKNSYKKSIRDLAEETAFEQ